MVVVLRLSLFKLGVVSFLSTRHRQKERLRRPRSLLRLAWDAPWMPQQLRIVWRVATTGEVADIDLAVSWMISVAGMASWRHGRGWVTMAPDFDVEVALPWR